MRNEPHYVYLYAPDAAPLRRRIHVPAEDALYLRLNGELAVVLMRQPGDDLELAVGHCLSEGLVAEPKAILSARHCLDNANTVDVFIEEARGAAYPYAAGRGREDTPAHAPTRLIDTACTGREVYMDRLPPPLSGDKTPLISPAELIALAAQLREHQEQYRVAGGVHAAALFDLQGQLVVSREDVGRNNAVDKVAGYCVLRRIPLQDLILLVTGRASSGMVLKAARLGIPILASLSNTTSLGLSLAKRLKLTLVTYLRGQRFEVACHRGRIRVEGQG